MDTAPVETPSRSPTGLVLAALSALRPKQWTKNGLLFAAIIFSMRFVQLEPWLQALEAFAAFCLISSAGYLFNDIRDREADRLHPSKRRRPIASGRLPVPLAWAEMALCLVAGSAIALYISPAFLAIALLYLFSTLSYSLYFKNHVILDVMFISAGFLWRAAAGAVAIGVTISPWLLMCTAFLSLFLGFNKRRGELMLLSGDAEGHRRNLAEYSQALVIEFQAITTSGTIISYALYTVLGSPTPWLLVTLPHVLYGIFRYIYLVTVRGEAGAPDEILLKDRGILLTCVLYAITAVIVLLVAPTTLHHPR